MKRLTIYIEQRFAILHCDHEATIKVNDNNSLIVTYKSDKTSWQRKYETLQELLLDTDLTEVDKWIARGLLGIPMCEIKNTPST
jgi:hypothetical protein